MNPEKSCWIYAGYQWTKGIWEYAPQPDSSMEIPLPDGSLATISQGDIFKAKKGLGVWSTVNSNDNKHLAQNVTGRIRKWITKMTNGHLPARLGWVAYKFKLWPGIHYGLAMLAMPLEMANNTLRRENFKLLPFFGINCNVKREWRALHCAFRGVGLFSLAVEHTIAMINMIV